MKTYGIGIISAFIDLAVNKINASNRDENIDMLREFPVNWALCLTNFTPKTRLDIFKPKHPKAQPKLAILKVQAIQPRPSGPTARDDNTVVSTAKKIPENLARYVVNTFFIN